MVTADERVESQLAIVLMMMKLAEVSYKVTSNTTRMKTKGPAT